MKTSHLPKRHPLLCLAALLALAGRSPQAAIAWEDAPEVTPACQVNCDEPAPSEDTSDSSDVSAGSSGGSAYEVNYDSPAYHFGQRIRQAIGLPSMYDLQDSTPPGNVGGQAWQTALDYNQQGLNYYEQRDWARAITAFRQALEQADHPTIQSNLRAAIASDYHQQGLDYAEQRDWARASTAFRQALEYAPDATVVQQHLREAEAELAAEEAVTHRQGSQLAATRLRIDGILERLTASLEAPPASMEALALQGVAVDVDGGSGAVTAAAAPHAMDASPSGGPFIDSSVVDLRDAKTLVVDPATVKGEPPGALEFMGADDLRDVHVLGPIAAAPPPAERIVAPTPSRKAEILLDALDHGHGNWEASFRYLQERLAEAPNDSAARGALADGLYAYYLDVGSGGTPEGNPLGLAREPEPTTREIMRDLERLGFGTEEARHVAAQLKADSAELAVVTQLEAQEAAEDDGSLQPQEDSAADASFKTAVYLGTALAAQGETEAGLLILYAVRNATKDDPDRQQHLNVMITSLEHLQRDADERRTR